MSSSITVRRKSFLNKLHPKKWASFLSKRRHRNKKSERSNTEKPQENECNDDTTTHHDLTTVQELDLPILPSAVEALEAPTSSGDQHLEKTMNKFLKETSVARPIVLLDRTEVRVGNLLGGGSFCEVFEVTGLRLASRNELRSKQYGTWSFDNHANKNKGSFSLPGSSLASLSTAATAATADDSTCPDASSVSFCAVLADPGVQRQREVFLREGCEEEGGAPKYALKQLSFNLLMTMPQEFQNAAADLMDEASYLKRFDHPNILKMHGVAIQGRDAFKMGNYDSFFIITERLSETLGDRIRCWKREGRKHKINDPGMLLSKTNYALQIASALKYLHERRIVYRDLKPDNLGFLMQPVKNNDNKLSEVLQLFDFGFCREMPVLSEDHPMHGNEDEHLFRMSRVGSPAYMAPEVILKGCRYNAKADVYSFALVFYQMLVLKKPYGRMSRFKAVESIATTGDRPDLSKYELPESIRSLLQATWEFSVEARLSSSQTHLQLQAILEELDVIHGKALLQQ